MKYEQALSANDMANLLGLELEEYSILIHAPLMANRNRQGKIIGYFMHISANNPFGLLKKINMLESNFKTFTVEELSRLLK